MYRCQAIGVQPGGTKCPEIAGLEKLNNSQAFLETQDVARQLWLCSSSSGEVHNVPVALFQVTPC